MRDSCHGEKAVPNNHFILVFNVLHTRDLRWRHCWARSEAHLICAAAGHCRRKSVANPTVAASGGCTFLMCPPAQAARRQLVHAANPLRQPVPGHRLGDDNRAGLGSRARHALVGLDARLGLPNHCSRPAMIAHVRPTQAGRLRTAARCCASAVAAACLLAACTSTPAYPPTAPSTGHRPPPREASFTGNELLKSDIDAVAEVHLRESIASARLVMEKLYRRNPRELQEERRRHAGSRGRAGVRSALPVALSGALQPAGDRRVADRLPSGLHRRPGIRFRRRARQHDHPGLRRQDAVLPDRQPRRPAPVQRRAQRRDRGVEARQRPRAERRAAATQQRHVRGARPISRSSARSASSSPTRTRSRSSWRSGRTARSGVSRRASRRRCSCPSDERIRRDRARRVVPADTPRGRASRSPQFSASSPCCTMSAARSTARALFCVSIHSDSGTESWTMPAPACT